MDHPRTRTRGYADHFLSFLSLQCGKEGGNSQTFLRRGPTCNSGGPWMIEDTAKARLRVSQIVAHYVDRFGARLGDLLRRHSTEEAHLNQNHQVRIFLGD